MEAIFTLWNQWIPPGRGRDSVGEMKIEGDRSRHRGRDKEIERNRHTEKMHACMLTCSTLGCAH